MPRGAGPLAGGWMSKGSAAAVDITTDTASTPNAEQLRFRDLYDLKLQRKPSRVARMRHPTGRRWAKGDIRGATGRRI